MRTTMTMDDGVQFGLGAFETIAVERGKGILLSRHLARLGAAAEPNAGDDHDDDQADLLDDRRRARVGV